MARGLSLTQFQISVMELPSNPMVTPTSAHPDNIATPNRRLLVDIGFDSLNLASTVVNVANPARDSTTTLKTR